MTYDIYNKALDLLQELEFYHEDQFSYDDKTEEEKYCELAMAKAFNKAWWILYYANHENWDELDKFENLFKKE